MSTYFPNIPQSGDDPSDSQPLILSNFQALNNAVSRNHTAMTDTANSGKHEFLQMPEQAAPPATAANEGGLYTRVVSGATQLFFREESSGTERQLTSAFTGATNGLLTIPGGLMIEWGTAAGVTQGTTITYHTAFSIAPYNIQITVIQDADTRNTVHVRSIGQTATTFDVSTVAAAIDIYWMATGLA